MRDLTQNVGNVLTIQHQTCVDDIFKCTIFVGYGGVIFFTGVPPSETNPGRFGPGSFRPESFRPGSFRPILGVGRFGLGRWVVSANFIGESIRP